MSKVLKIAGEVVAIGAVAVLTAGAGLALAAGASIGGAIAGAGAIFAGTIGLSIGSVLAIGAGLTLAGGLLAKKPQVSPSQIDRTNVSLVVDAPRTIVFGHTALATDLRYQEFFGNNQENCGQVLLLASHWCESVEQVWLNDVLAWSATGGTQGIYNAYFYVKYFAQAVAGNSFTSGWSQRWGANAAFVGCATLYLEFKTSPNSSNGSSPFGSGIPTRITIRGKAARVYDPRLDTSVGGSGAMRVADQSTWAWASGSLEIGRNPALCMLFYLLGWRIQNPVTGVWKLAVGLGIPVDRIDLGSFMTGANLCDEPVTLAAGGTEPRYRCDGMFSEADDPGTVLTALEGCMNAQLRDSAGKFVLQVFHNDLATPVIDLTDDDVLDDFTWDAGGALNDLKNVVKGRYTDPSDTSLYQLVDYPTRSIASLDGVDRIDVIDQALVQSPGQAQRLANQRLERYQYPGTFAGNFKARAWVLKDGDIVRLTFSALGFSQKLLRVAKATIQVTGVVPLVLAEENAAIYAWDSSDSAAIVVAAPQLFDPLQQPIQLAIADAAETAAWSMVADDNSKRPEDNATVGAIVGTNLKNFDNTPINILENGATKGATLGVDITDEHGNILTPAEILNPDLMLAPDGTLTAVIDGVSTPLGTVALPDLGAASDTARRQLESDLASISAAVAQLGAGQAIVQNVFRDAGLYTDPANGTAKLFAIETRAEQITNLSVSLDAALATVATKASQTVVDAQGARLTLAEQTITALDGASISQAVTASRQVPANSDVAGATTILDLLNGAQNAMLAQTGIAQARNELTAQVNDAFTAVASLSLTLGARIGAANAAIGTNQQAQVAGDQALATSIASYQASTGTTLASVNQALVAQTTTNQSLAGSIATVSSTLNGQTSTLTTYGQSINGLLTKYGVEINASGVVTGFTLNNGGGRTDLVFVVNGFKIAQPDGSGARTVFNITNAGVVQMHAVEVDTLAVNTAIIPVVSTSSTGTYGTSTTTSGDPNAFVALFQKSINIPTPGLIRLECNMKQGFTNGLSNRPWQLYLTVNGNQLPESVESGTVPGDSVTSVGFYYAAQPGIYSISAIWGAHSSIVAQGRSFCALGLIATNMPPDTSDGGNYTATGGGTGGGGGGGGGFRTNIQ